MTLLGITEAAERNVTSVTADKEPQPSRVESAHWSLVATLVTVPDVQRRRGVSIPNSQSHD